MRVISGKFKGRTIHEAHGHRTHPMSEKMRGALFNVLGDIENLTVFDSFTGTGAIALEAISRGAKNVVAVDIDKEAYRTAVKNNQGLPVKVSLANVGSWIDSQSDITFDIVIADPPYDDVRWAVLEKIANCTKIHGIFVVSLPSHETEMNLQLLSPIHIKSYGDAKLVFYRRLR